MASKALLVTAALAVLSIGSTHAADYPVKAPPPPPVVSWNWSGFYFGGEIGGYWSDVDYFWPAGDHMQPAGTGITQHPGGAFGGVFGGYQFQFDRFVLGVEGGWASGMGNTAATGNAPFASPVGSDPVTATSDIGGIVMAVGKGGVAFDRWMVYAKGGWAGGEVQTRVLDSANHVAQVGVWHDGYVVGGGLEYMWTRNFIVGVEYKYIHLNTKSHNVDNVGGAAPVNSTQDVKAAINAVTVRASWKF